MDQYHKQCTKQGYAILLVNYLKLFTPESNYVQLTIISEY